MKIPQKTYRLWRIRILILFVTSILSVICLAVFFGWLILPTVLFFAFLTVLFALVNVWLLPLYFKSYRIYSNKSIITVSKGIIFKSHIVLPNKKLISISRISLPDAQRCNLAAVFIRFYKGLVFIPEIDKNVAKELILSLSEKNNEN